jgi:tripartite-type tricarboxylate transporter receptor subunit TctC
MPFERLKRHDFITLLGVAAAVMVTAPLLTAGQDYPNRPVTLIVNFPPGGSTDAMARIHARALSQLVEACANSLKRPPNAALVGFRP